MRNIEIVKLILEILKKPEELIEFVKDRPGHDRRYAIDASKLKGELEWQPSFDFEDAIQRTVEWYLNNRSWWENILNRQYLKYYEQQYGAGSN
jgi:dTDP-glucose 4,6-dehydratase